MMNNLVLLETRNGMQIFIRKSDVHRRKCVKLLNGALDKMELARNILVNKKRSTTSLDKRMNLAKMEIRNHIANMGYGVAKKI